MRQKRAKSYRKQMSYYHINFGFREPYQVLVDEEIVREAVKTKFDLFKALERTLQGPVKPMIAQCTYDAVVETRDWAAINLARSLERRQCAHKQEEHKFVAVADAPAHGSDTCPAPSQKKGAPRLSMECIVQAVNVKGKNKHRYVVATQKARVRAILRRLVGVPLVYINRSVMLLEPMSAATEKARAVMEQSKLTSGLNDPHCDLKAVKPEAVKRRRAHAPNPLSVKKKKPRPHDAESSCASDTKTRRKRTHRRKTKDPEASDDVASDPSV